MVGNSAGPGNNHEHNDLALFFLTVLFNRPCHVSYHFQLFSSFAVSLSASLSLGRMHIESWYIFSIIIESTTRT